jgi:DNA mismatch repair protein MutL
VGKIQKLPESLIRLIAAGEVIERPASVLKELVENSIDAGATHIQVDILGSGRTRLRVTDNGEGMTRQDAELALDRHATSKLKAFDDLQALHTFGFRGEALPSIAAVSRLTLTTRTREESQGWRLSLEGGKLLNATAVGCAVGTTIDVQDLFFNTPARDKFMKRDSTERTHLLKTLQEIALAHPAVHFEVSMEGKDTLNWASSAQLGERIGDIWGLSVAEQLVPLNVSQGPCTIRGFINAIPAHHPTKAYQLLYVNQRPVQQRMLTHAIYEAYKEWLPVGRHPIFLLFIDVDPSLVDVNVHPSKREVRFSDERALYDVLYTQIQKVFKIRTPLPSTPVQGAWHSPHSFSHPSTTMVDAAHSLFSPSEGALADIVSDVLAIPEKAFSAKGTRYLGQFQHLYLLIERGEELLLVDQHAAAERVLYERLLAQAAEQRIVRQPLLTPLMMDVGPGQAESIRSYLSELDHMGFSVEPFGPHTFALKEWPSVLPDARRAKRFFEEILEALAEERPTGKVAIEHEIAARAACRAAIMAGDPITPPEVTQLLNDLSECERPMTCPHGRPTHLPFSIAELNRRFGRT